VLEFVSAAVKLIELEVKVSKSTKAHWVPFVPNSVAN
jgi:hypothetical protein